MRPSLLIAALFGIQVATCASEVWTVPATPLAASLGGPGFVVADRSGMTPLRGAAERTILAWVAGHGQVVRAGDPVAVFDTSPVSGRVAVKQAEVALAEATLAQARLEAAKAQAELQERRRALTADLAAVRARRAALGSDAAARQALARGRQALTELNLQQQARDAGRTRIAVAVGASPEDETLRAEAALRLAQAQARTQAAVDARIEEDADPAITDARLASQEAALALRLGLGADGRPDPRLGLEARIALGADQGSITRLEADLEGNRRELHEALRDAVDHTPVAWIELTPSPGGPPRRYDLAVLERSGQGFGWNQPVETTGDGPARRFLVAGHRTWRATVTPGTWRIAVGLGDRVDWDGALVQVLRPGEPPRTIHASTRLEAGTQVTASADLAIPDGRIELGFGGVDDGPDRRTVRAPVAGTVLLQPDTQRGMRLRRGFRPFGFLANSAAVQIAARVPLEEAGFYAAASAADPLAGIARQGLEVILPDGRTRPATVAALGAKPVSRKAALIGWDETEDDNPQDLVANDLTLALAGAAGQPPPLRTAVTVRAPITVPEGWAAVPPHLVGRTDRQAWVRTPGGPARTVTAKRCGPVELVQGLRPGDRLGDPGAAPVEGPANVVAGAAGYPGEIIARERVRVVVPQIWGLVQELIPEGRDVHQGEEILSVYSPWLDAQREQIAQDRRRAETERAQAVRDRQAKALDEADRRSDQTAAAQAARADLAAAVRARPERRQAALAALAAARERGTEARRRLAAWQAVDAGERRPDGRPLPALTQAMAAASTAAAEEARAEIEAAATAEALLPGAQAQAAALRQEDLLAGRSGDAAVAAAERRAAIARAEARALGAQDLATWAEDFNRLRRITAPAAGRLYWATAWNEQTRSMGKVTRETMLWGGMAIAEIVDLGKLGASFEVPEDRWRHLQEGQEVTVTVPSLGGLHLPGRIAQIARLVETPRDSRLGNDLIVADPRVFRVTVALDAAALAPGVSAAGTLQPGLKTLLTLPETP